MPQYSNFKQPMLPCSLRLALPHMKCFRHSSTFHCQSLIQEAKTRVFVCSFTLIFKWRSAVGSCILRSVLSGCAVNHPLGWTYSLCL